MTDGLTALRRGRAVVDLSTWRKVLVRGADAAAWLNDLLTAELEGIRSGEGRRSLLLSPTGRIRADLTVTPHDDGLLLLQDPIQASPIDGALTPYVLSSDVSLEDVSDRLGLLALPDGAAPEGSWAFRPSPLGTGRGLLFPRDVPPKVSGLEPADPQDLEAFRIERGVPRFGVDLAEDSLPHEAPLDEAIAHGKGCFLGQEAVAKVRNLGHPPFVVLSLDAPTEVSAGDRLMAGDREVGRITSATRSDGGAAALGRVRWTARDAELSTGEGTALRRTDIRPTPGSAL
jgi:tRNA-modifying protein YgfZ